MTHYGRALAFTSTLLQNVFPGIFAPMSGFCVFLDDLLKFEDSKSVSFASFANISRLCSSLWKICWHFALPVNPLNGLKSNVTEQTMVTHREATQNLIICKNQHNRVRNLAAVYIYALSFICFFDFAIFKKIAKLSYKMPGFYNKSR